ncbi:MAG: DUF1080 domain-containing protein [Bryobacteraceae bacterium]
MFSKTCILTLICAATCLAADKPNSLTKKESSQGWKLLFDGANMNGWESHWGDTFHVKDGALACDGSVMSWLSTKDSFSNYELKLEFRGNEKVNSGVFLRSEKEGQPHITGYELQIWDYQPAKYNTGSLVGTAFAEPTKILGDRWNQYDITAEGDHFVIVLNGKKLLDTHDSKHASGVIGFQCQKEQQIEFRNIKILPRK